jgi:hypothetical protein
MGRLQKSRDNCGASSRIGALDHQLLREQSPTRWSLRGANAIIALRCAQLSGRWEEFWEMRAAS